MANLNPRCSLVLFSCDTFYEKNGRIWSSPIARSSISLFADNFSTVGIVSIFSPEPPDPEKHVPFHPNYRLYPIAPARGIWARLVQGWRVLKLARTLTRQYDVAYLRMFSYESLPAALYCSLFLRKPWFLGLHGDIEEAVIVGYPFMNPLRRAVLAKTLGFLSRLICRRPTPLFTAGPALGIKYAPQRKDWVPFMDCGIRQKDIFAERRDTCSVPPCKLIYVGDMSRRKGIDVILAALSILKKMKIPATLSIIGKGSNAESDALFTLAKQLQVAELVELAGYFPYGEKLFARIRQGDILVVGSRGSEGTCRVITEANTQGLPVVTTDVDSLGIFVREWSFGLAVPPDNPQAMADAIRFIIENPDQRKKMVAQALARGRHYIYQNEFARIRTAMEKVFSGHLVPLDNIPTERAGL